MRQRKSATPWRVAIGTAGLTALAVAVAAAQSPVTVNIDANANRIAIDPNIYGVAYATTANLLDLNSPLNRLGGDNMTCYNWWLNATNQGVDWYFESVPLAGAAPGGYADSFISTTDAGGASSMIAVPMLGWVANLGSGGSKLASYSIAKYGAQTGNDSAWMPDAGNGVLASNNQAISYNNPNDAQVPADTSMQQGWLKHMVSTFGNAANGGPKYYLTDNEPSMWHSTHRDVHPVGATMDEVLNDIINYGAMVKSTDPTAQVVGPEEWGWTGYLYSGYDQQYGPADGWSYLPDYASHGDMYYIPYLLQQLAAYNASTGVRPLDVLSVHYYPQGGEYSDDTSTATELLRNESTRSLWDPNYVDQSWIGARVELIPRLKSWVNQYYPGTKVAITEYNWGAEDSMNGATTQADIYGIFGREGLDMATRWTVPDPSTPTYKAMKMYRDYDSSGSCFGDTSVSDVVPDPDDLSSFAAIRGVDNALTVMVINKVLSGSTPVTLNLANFAGNGVAKVWQLNSSNTITRFSDITYSGSSLSLTVPAQSVTLLILAPSTAAVPLPAKVSDLYARGGNGLVELQWDASVNAVTYSVLRSVGSGPYTVVGSTTGTTYTDTTVVNGTTYNYEVTAANPAGSGKCSNAVTACPSASIADTAEYNFESSIQGWQSSGGMIDALGPSIVTSYRGVQSLAVPISASGADTEEVYVTNPSVPAGATVTFHIRMPAGNQIASVQPYVLQGASGNWTWTGNYQTGSALSTSGWTTLTVTVPPNAATPLCELGVQFSTSGPYTGTVYIDSISW